MLSLPAALATQADPPPKPDPLLTCRRRAAALVNAVMDGVSAQRRGGLQNGNDIILWNAKLTSGGSISGFCESNPRSGRVVRMGSSENDSGNINRKYRMTPIDAEKVCQREARARFSPGNGLIGAVFLQNISTKNTYHVEWQYNALAGRPIRTGTCEIDPFSGHIREFHANSGW
jgi:hypothetical protein